MPRNTNLQRKHYNTYTPNITLLAVTKVINNLWSWDTKQQENKMLLVTIATTEVQHQKYKQAMMAKEKRKVILDHSCLKVAY